MRKFHRFMNINNLHKYIVISVYLKKCDSLLVFNNNNEEKINNALLLLISYASIFIKTT